MIYQDCIPYILFYILTLASPLAAVFTQKENVLQAYDCTEPRGVTDRALGDDSIFCDHPHQHTTMEANQTYQLLVEEKVRRFTGWKCSVRDSRDVTYCGNYDHQTAFAKLNYRKLPIIVSPLKCRSMRDTRKYKDPKGNNHEINRGGVTAIFYEEIGSTWATGIKPGETSEVECHGGSWEVAGMHLTDMIVTHQLRVTLVREEFREEDGQVQALSDGTLLQCPATRGNCETAEATYLWDVPREVCTMGVSKTVTGVVATDQEGEQVFMSTDNSLVRLVFTQKESHCGRVVQATNYPNLFLAKLPSSFPFHRQIEAASISLSTYINNRDDFLYNHMADVIDAELGSVLQHDCREKLKRRRHQYYLQHNIPGLATYTLGNGTFASSAGEALYFYQCRSLLVRGLTANKCYDALPVHPIDHDDPYDDKGAIPDVAVNPDLFLEPLTRRLTTSAAEIPCSATFRAKYQLLNHRWMSADPHLRETVAPQNMETTEALRVSIPRNIDWSKGGVYKQEELKKLETILETPRKRNALDWTIANQLSPSYQQGPLRPEHLFPNMQGFDYYSGFLSDLLSFLDRFGEGSAILVSLYIIYRGISGLIGWLYGGKQFFKAFGCSPNLFWSFCPTLWLLKKAGPTNDDDAPPGNRSRNYNIFRRHPPPVPPLHLDTREYNPDNPLMPPPAGPFSLPDPASHDPNDDPPTQSTQEAYYAVAQRPLLANTPATPPSHRHSKLAPTYQPPAAV